MEATQATSFPSADLVSADQVSAKREASPDLVSAQEASTSKPSPPSLPPNATRASTRVRFPTAKAMESARRAPTKRKAAPAEEPAVKKPRTAAKASAAKASTATSHNVKKTKITKTQSKAKSSAPKKVAKAVAKAPAASAKSIGVKAEERALQNGVDGDTDPEEEIGQPGPSSKQPTVPKKPTTSKKSTRAPIILPIINAVPTHILDVYVFGEGSASELGLGNAKGATNVKRPRLNPFLLAKEVGVVAVACGGMHSAVITHDNRILTWGVNDLGALGRDTTWSGGWKDENADPTENINEDEIALNPHECKPAAVSSEHFPEGTKFAAVACGDSSTFVLTDTGLVYGWGTFRGNEGVFGFSPATLGGTQKTPVLIEKVKNVTQIACGANHVLALNQRGEVWTWGSGEQNQLGHRIVERRKYDTLSPKLLRVGHGKIRLIGCGHYHSFAVDASKRIWAWGLNSFGQAGIQSEAGQDGAIVFSIVRMDSLKLPANEIIESITGGAHHSAAITSLGRCFMWGRIDGHQMGIATSDIPEEDMIYDARDMPRILMRPTPVPGLGKVVSMAIGTDHTITVNEEGKAFSWGFNVNYQCGQGAIDDVVTPTHIDNTAVRGKKLIWVGAGGQFSILAGTSEFQNPSTV